MIENPKNHWDTVYRTKAPDAVSWYRAHLETSIALIQRVAPESSASIIDIGGGESTLGRPPENGDGGRLNTVTRVVSKRGDEPAACWWDPKNNALWMRVPFCEWMPKEGWTKQGGMSPAWFRAGP